MVDEQLTRVSEQCQFFEQVIDYDGVLLKAKFFFSRLTGGINSHRLFHSSKSGLAGHVLTTDGEILQGDTREEKTKKTHKKDN